MAAGIQPWGHVREIIEAALEGNPHQRCSVEALASVLDRGFGRVALVALEGIVRGVVWEIERRARTRQGSLGTPERKRSRCADTDYLGSPMMVLDRLLHQGAGLAVPHDASVRWDGVDIRAGDASSEVEEKLRRWLVVTDSWSRKPRAHAAFVCMVRDHRIVWVGTYVWTTPGPEVSARAQSDT